MASEMGVSSRFVEFTPSYGTAACNGEELSAVDALQGWSNARQVNVHWEERGALEALDREEVIRVNKGWDNEGPSGRVSLKSFCAQVCRRYAVLMGVTIDRMWVALEIDLK